MKVTTFVGSGREVGKSARRAHKKLRMPHQVFGMYPKDDGIYWEVSIRV